MQTNPDLTRKCESCFLPNIRLESYPDSGLACTFLLGGWGEGRGRQKEDLCKQYPDLHADRIFGWSWGRSKV